MLVSISYKNWPSVVYIKYNNIKVTDKLFEDYQNDINSLINKINEYRIVNKNDIYIVLNINEMKTINLDYANKQSKFYDYIIKNIKKNIKFIYLIVKNDQIKFLVRCYINLKYPKERKIFKCYKTKEKVQQKLNALLFNKQPIKMVKPDKPVKPVKSVKTIKNETTINNIISIS